MDERQKSRSPNGLAARIRSALEFDTRFDLREAKLSITESPGQLVLTGEVPDIGSKRIAANRSRLEAAADIQVDDRLHVATERVADQEIGRHICNHLAADEAFANCAIALHLNGRTDLVQQPLNGGLQHLIEIAVDDGVIQLVGSVGSLNHRRLTEVLCWWVPGCRRVDNALEVRPPEQDSDNTLTDAVRAVLERDPLLDASQVTARTVARVVELRGHTRTSEEKQLAIRDAWAVEGVSDVRCGISAGPVPVQ